VLFEKPDWGEYLYFCSKSMSLLVPYSVEKFILDLWSENIKDSVITQIDAKTKLQEFSLKRFKKLPIYKLISNTGPRHKPLFKVGVKLIDTKLFIAQGKSKKDAEQNAAIICLQNINKL